MKYSLLKVTLRMVRAKPMLSIGMMLGSVLMLWVLAWGIVEIMVLQPRYLLSMWEQNKKELADDDWHDAVETMRFAVQFNPLSSEYTFDLGRLYEWRALERQAWTRHARENRFHAISYFRESARCNPSWALAWINLAASKILNQELDQEAIKALDNAARYGPWEQGVHKKTIWLGLAIWDQLPITTRTKIEFIIEQSLKEGKSVQFIMDTASRFQWQDNLNYLMEDMESIH